MSGFDFDIKDGDVAIIMDSESIKLLLPSDDFLRAMPHVQLISAIAYLIDSADSDFISMIQAKWKDIMLIDINMARA